MNSSMTALSNVPPYPAPLPGAVVPAQLRGTRAAIFHLLRTDEPPKEARRPCPPTPVVATQAPPVRARQQAPGLPVHSTGMRGFLYGDQFEFLSADIRGAASRRDRPGHNQYPQSSG